MNTQSKVFKGNGKEIITWNAVNSFEASTIGVVHGMKGEVASKSFTLRSEADAYAIRETGSDVEVSQHGWSGENQIETVEEAQADAAARARTY